ncbi:MAG TPA: hypothetical protein VMU73_08395 [Gaiellaceae bacterium]|nr:hypothetical protein [Gaiellaceae bacterium]
MDEFFNDLAALAKTAGKVLLTAGACVFAELVDGRSVGGLIRAGQPWDLFGDETNELAAAKSRLGCRWAACATEYARGHAVRQRQRRRSPRPAVRPIAMFTARCGARPLRIARPVALSRAARKSMLVRLAIVVAS